MKRYFLFFGLATTMAIPSCVKNPYLTEDKFLSEPNAAKTWASGIKRQLATTTNAVVVNAELISDNYFNNYTQNSKVFDIPQIDYFDVDVNTSQVEVQRLREMAVYGLSKVVAVDPAATAQDKAVMYFALAYSYLLSGEMFVALPTSSQEKCSAHNSSWKKRSPCGMMPFPANLMPAKSWRIPAQGPHLLSIGRCCKCHCPGNAGAGAEECAAAGAVRWTEWWRKQ